MKKVYALYNINNHCLEHLEKVNINTNNHYIIFKLDNIHGDIWITKDIKIAEAVRLGKCSDLTHTSREMPYNPYSAAELEVVELDIFYENAQPVLNLKASEDLMAIA